MSFQDVGPIQRPGGMMVSGGGPQGYYPSGTRSGDVTFGQPPPRQQQYSASGSAASALGSRETQFYQAQDRAGPQGRALPSQSVEGALGQISDWLRQLQQNLLLLDRLGDGVAAASDPSDELLRQVVTQQEVVNELSMKVRRALTDLPRRIEDLPSSERPRPKAATGKLRKDFDRVSAELRRVLEKIKQARRLAIVKQQQQRGLQPRRPAGQTGATDDGGRVRAAKNGALAGPSRVGRAQFGPSDAPGDLDVVIGNERVQLQVAMQEEAINDAILREREEEIRVINQDVHKVNEIFRDLATLVDKQQSEVDQIDDLVSKSHQHAEKGLDQVQKAAKLQPSCVVS